jgi:hypothetical protein
MPSPPIAVRDRELRIAAGSLLALIFVVNVYRAATQSITHDEAYTYLCSSTASARVSLRSRS